MILLDYQKVYILIPLKDDYQDSIADEYDFRTFYLSGDRSKMHITLNNRCEAMFHMGILEEVYDLLKRDKDIHFKNSKSSESIGYREITDLLLKPVIRNNIENDNEKSTTTTTTTTTTTATTTTTTTTTTKTTINLKESLNQIEKSDVVTTILNFQTSNRNYYRRQYSWFKKEKNFECIIKSLELPFNEWQKNRDLKKEEEIRTCSPKETKLISKYKPRKELISFVLENSNKLRNSLIQSNPELFD
ncbi:hypothetical protein ACTFIV_007161 [Dictyostelium citrinum]